MKNAIGYIRLSTEAQAMDDRYSIESQKQAIKAYATENNYTVVSWLIDTISGVKDNRPEFDKILYSPPEGIKAVIVFKNDRIARDTKLYFYYFYTLEKKNIKLLSTEEHFSEGDDFANVYRSLLMFVAEQERRNIALRTSKGRSIKAQCGGYSGGRIPYGYRVVDGVLTIDDEEKPIVQKIFEEIDNGTPMLAITEILEKAGFETRKRRRFQVSTIKSIISNRPLYEGSYKYGKEMDWVKGVHKPILKKED